jgi:hypothetical protein
MNWLSIVSSRRKSNILKNNLFYAFGSKRIKYLLFAIAPVSVLLFYGIEDKNSWFFGHDYINDYRYKTNNNAVYHIGIMVSHYSLLVTLAIVGILIIWIIYEGLRSSKVFENHNQAKR